MLLESTRSTGALRPALDGWRPIAFYPEAQDRTGSRDGLITAFDPDFPQTATRTRFTALERAAVRLGARDTPASLRPHSRWQRVKFLVFGFTPATTLSNPRLEAMRRLVIELRHSCGRGLAPIRARAVEAGISEPQIGALMRRFARRRRQWWQTR
ncbi:hypothetical protein [Sphingomonas hengshuiensis]|uniref:Uncharacterized protein n=1 Tax=Sphingomonas hengshuiensis TaxID=1609977 RepID=A0A7U4J6I1_9SPHN|nr:hypothetical protein [Sphingomonas hengshuiensis]AJP71155.1 hypothetical protein TS85_03955 [Sphingomonas hengshuiensis]